MKFIREMLAHKNKTTTILTSMILDAKGWSAGKIDPEVVPLPPVYLYAWDRPTNWAWMCSVPLEFFASVTAKVRRDQRDWQAIRGALGKTLNTCATLTDMSAQSELAAENGKALSWSELLAFLLCAYAGTTKVLEVSGPTQPHGHFLTLHYRKDQAQPDGMLRPFVAPARTAAPLDSDIFLGMVDQVVRMDLQRHPEWFR